MMLKNLSASQVISVMFIRLILDQVAIIKSVLDFNMTQLRAIITAHIHFVLRINLWYKKRKIAKKLTKNRNEEGVYNGSIVWDYFIKKKKSFSALK